MKLSKIDHVGIAVRNLDSAIEYFAQRYGATIESREHIAQDKVEEAMIKIGESYIQLVAPTAEDSPVAKFLETRGEGIHHLGFSVGDLDNLLVELAAQGARLVDERPRLGGGGKMVAFVHPKDGLGVLVELVQE
jgi:methylmalonyl-CoA/ethylmalonyl-CoA epimerase